MKALQLIGKTTAPVVRGVKCVGRKITGKAIVQTSDSYNGVSVGRKIVKGKNKAAKLLTDFTSLFRQKKGESKIVSNVFINDVDKNGSKYFNPEKVTQNYSQMKKQLKGQGVKIETRQATNGDRLITVKNMHSAYCDQIMDGTLRFDNQGKFLTSEFKQVKHFPGFVMSESTMLGKLSFPHGHIHNYVIDSGNMYLEKLDTSTYRSPAMLERLSKKGIDARPYQRKTRLLQDNNVVAQLISQSEASGHDIMSSIRQGAVYAGNVISEKIAHSPNIKIKEAPLFGGQSVKYKN